MEENIFDGMDKEQIKRAMDILYILSDENRKRIEMEYRRRWEEQGKRQQKQRELDDFISRL